MIRRVLLLVFACGDAFAGPVQHGHILAINEDNDRYFLSASRDPNLLTADGARGYFDSVAAGGAVTHFFMCVNGQRTSFDSKVWEPIWLGVNDRTENGTTNNAWCVNAKILNDRGIDIWKIWCARAREKGISPWISMRMNDGHYAHFDYKVHRNESYWWEHPELWRNPAARQQPKKERRQTDCVFDFSKEKVREHAMALVREILGRWDMDGIELDWMRQSFCLPPGRARECAPVLTAFMERVKAECAAAAARLGHPVKVCVRTPTTLLGAEEMGFDVVTWARKGLVDVVVPSPGYWVPDFDMDVLGWKRALSEANPSVFLLPCTDIGMHGSPTCRFLIWKDLGFLRGWAANAAGGDGLYLFNAPYYGEPQRSDVYAGALTAERIVRERRRFPVTHHEGAPRAHSGVQLPANIVQSPELRVRVTRGPYDAGARVVVAVDRPCDRMPEMTLNGKKPLAQAERMLMDEVFPARPKVPCDVFAWDVPLDAVHTGTNLVHLVGSGMEGRIVWCEISLDARPPLKPGEMPPKPWVVINEDNDRYFIAADKPGRIEKTTAEACERYLDTVMDGGKVTHFFMCVCGQRASFGSKAWEPIWTGLEGGVEKDGVTPATNNAWCLNAKLMHEKGVDPYAIRTRRCRERGVSPWISMRMNDNHFCNITNYFRNENFWRFHPELRLKRPVNKPEWASNFLYNNLDYAEEAVRAHAYAMVDEILERWDADGIEIDWMRCPNNLSPSKEEELSWVLTEFMRGVRRRTDEAARRRGHPVRVAARIPPVLPMARSLGYDAESWARDGSVDIVILCNSFSSAEFNFDMADWQSRIRRQNPSVTVLPGSDVCVACCYPARLLMSGENIAFRHGWCVAHRNPGGFYFFNMPYMPADAQTEAYSRSLLPARLETKERRFAVSYHDVNWSGKRRAMQLPAPTCNPISLVTRAAAGRFDSIARVVVGFDSENADFPASVTLNGVAATGPHERLGDASRCGELAKSAACWRFPASAIRDGENRMEFAAVPGSAAKMVWCDIELPAPTAKEILTTTTKGQRR